MKKVGIVTVGGVLIALVVVYSVEAKLPSRWWKRPAIATRLKLTEDQAQELDQGAFDYRTKAIDLKARLQQQKSTVKYLLQQDTMDKKAVVEACVAVAKIRTEILANGIDEKLAMRESLTPLQQEKVEEMKHRRPKKAEKKGPGRKARGRKEKLFKNAVAGTWWENPEVAADIGLTDEQIKGLRDSSYKIGQSRVELKAQRKIKGLTLKRAVDSSEVDRKAVESLVKEIGVIDEAIAKNRAEAMIAERELLTGEQLDKIKAVKAAEARERREFRRQLALERAGREKRPPVEPSKRDKPRREA